MHSKHIITKFGLLYNPETNKLHNYSSTYKNNQQIIMKKRYKFKHTKSLCKNKKKKFMNYKKKQKIYKQGKKK